MTDKNLETVKEFNETTFANQDPVDFPATIFSLCEYIINENMFYVEWDNVDEFFSRFNMDVDDPTEFHKSFYEAHRAYLSYEICPEAYYIKMVNKFTKLKMNCLNNLVQMLS